ncbi:MAG: 4-alpha-glucanotransferase [Calditrichia bacterium]
MAELTRSSGLLLHPTSLPGPHGIGDFGEMAYRWIDFLTQSRQTIWQILPLGPTGYGDSPYQTTSVFAGNPLLIDLSQLSADGYLPPIETIESPEFSAGHVDFGAVIPWKKDLLLQSYGHFSAVASTEARNEFDEFCRRYDDAWLEDYAMFMAIKGNFGEQAWPSWPKEYRQRNSKALAAIRLELIGKINAYKFQQYIFFKQWLKLKSYANERGVQIMGDIPIYVTHDSADVWSNQDLFLLDDDGNPTVVAGVPPDYFSPDGQLWGNPLYDWDLMKKNGYRWWKERIRINLECVDLVRLDHFRGFESYYTVAFGAETARVGTWEKGPANAFFDSLLKEFGELPIIAEDLGLITPEVNKLRDDYKMPGMKILQFAFGGGQEDAFLPHTYESSNCVIYTGSHDNDTVLGWYHTANDHERRYCVDYLGTDEHNLVWGMIRTALASIAVLAILPVQDVLSLDSSARMNTPGMPSGNWSWRLLADQLNEQHAVSLARLTEVYGRAQASK